VIISLLGANVAVTFNRYSLGTDELNGFQARSRGLSVRRAWEWAVGCVRGLPGDTWWRDVTYKSLQTKRCCRYRCWLTFGTEGLGYLLKSRCMRRSALVELSLAFGETPRVLTVKDKRQATRVRSVLSTK
jgi:hypothetical protein